jgi:phytoene dehydrogenase-like protein
MNRYDVIVVGGGLGGLAAGITAAKRGRRTLLLEKHTTVGGLAAGFRRKGYYFDSGMSRVMGASVRAPLKELGLLGKADLRPYRAIWNVAGRWIDYSRLSVFFAGLAELFSEERTALLSLYEREVKPKEKLFGVMFRDTSSLAPPLRFLHLLRLFATFPSIIRSMSSKETEAEILARYLSPAGQAYRFLGERVDEVDYRGEMSFATKVGKWYTQMFNVYPAMGFQRLADLMAAMMRERGGEVRTSSSVRRIRIEEGKAVGVEAGRDGGTEEIAAESVICCIDLKKAFHELIGTQFIGEELVSRVDRSRLSSPVPILYLGLNIPAQTIREHLQGFEEVFYYPAVEPNEKPEEFYRDHPMVIHSSCFHNPGHAPAGRCALQVYLSDSGEGWMEHWGINEGRRTEAYRNLKKTVIEHALGAMERIIPELEDRSLLEVCELGTPFTFERYTGNTSGAALGFRMDEDYLNSRKYGQYFDHIEGIENLYFAGQQAGYPGGVGNALGSGKHAGQLA